MNEIQSIGIFLRVAELSSFTQAARQLGLPNASVSTAVQELEHRLGTRLLHRTTRRVTLTSDGLAFYERSKNVLMDVDELRTMFRNQAEELKGRLRVDMPGGMAKHVVIPHLAGFLEKHPLLQLDLGSADRHVDLVKEGFDCVLRVGRLSDSSLVARSLGQVRMANCASPDYIKRHGLPQRLEDLATHRLIEYDPALGARPAGWEWFDGKRTRHAPIPAVLTVNNTETYEAACVAGLGIIQAPAMGLQRLTAQGALVEILPAYTPAPMPVSILYQDRRQVPARVLAFMDWLAGLVHPYTDQAAPFFNSGLAPLRAKT
jgi:DNA-binding transcriptional LysR family regulator